MKVYWLLRYYLKLGTKNISFKISVESSYSAKELIENDVILQLNELVQKYTNFNKGYAYRLKTEVLASNLWLCKIIIKESYSSKQSSKIYLIYKLSKSSNTISLIK